MAFKCIAVIALMTTVVNAYEYNRPAGYASYSVPQSAVYSAPATKAILTKTVEVEYDHHPRYSYSYGVHDSHTGDIKSHQESRDGDVVKGSYSLVEPDGSRRTVHYTADSVHGFNAVVDKQPAAVAPVTFDVNPAPKYHAPQYHAPAVRTSTSKPIEYAYPVPTYQSYRAAPKVATPIHEPSQDVPRASKPFW